MRFCSSRTWLTTSSVNINQHLVSTFAQSSTLSQRSAHSFEHTSPSSASGAMIGSLQTMHLTTYVRRPLILVHRQSQRGYPSTLGMNRGGQCRSCARQRREHVAPSPVSRTVGREAVEPSTTRKSQRESHGTPLHCGLGSTTRPRSPTPSSQQDGAGCTVSTSGEPEPSLHLLGPVRLAPEPSTGYQASDTRGAESGRDVREPLDDPHGDGDRHALSFS